MSHLKVKILRKFNRVSEILTLILTIIIFWSKPKGNEKLYIRGLNYLVYLNRDDKKKVLGGNYFLPPTRGLLIQIPEFGEFVNH